MTKAQIAALFLAGAGAGAAPGLITAQLQGSKVVVQTVCVKNVARDGGIDAQVETCGTVQKPGELPMRWCDVAPETAASRKLLTDAPARMASADTAGRTRQTEIRVKLDEIRKAEAQKAAAKADAGR